MGTRKQQCMRQTAVTEERLERNLRAVDLLLDIHQGDYRPMDPEEARRRIENRMREQDEVIFPARQSACRVTPEWKNYARERGL